MASGRSIIKNMDESWAAIDLDRLEALVVEIEKNQRAACQNMRKAQKIYKEMKDKEGDQGCFPDWGLLVDIHRAIRSYWDVKNQLDKAKKSINIAICACRTSIDLRHQHYTKQMRRKAQEEESWSIQFLYGLSQP